MNYPNPDKHFWASITKSVIRVAGYCIIPLDINLAAGILVLSEVIGIIEEMV